MEKAFHLNVESLCQEQGIDRDLVIEAIKEAVRAAAKKQFKGGEDIQVDWTPEAGLELSASKVVVEEVQDASTELSIEEARELGGDHVEVGDALLLPMPMEELGRIAAQTAKQILFQKVLDAVRSNVYEQYIDRVGELMNGFVKRFERGNMIVDLGNLEAILPRSQQSGGEQWNQGERIRVVITNVSKESKGPQIEVSRTSPELLERLFEMEVPEIYDGTVVIKSCVREPGERAKIAVVSNERDVDPVGACVGMKGSRLQAIIRELRGEKIDIIEWSEEPSVFAANSLSPAKVTQVRITDIENRQMEVIVNEDQLSLAIGKRGQNVRLATELVGWNIDIRSEEEIKREITEEIRAFATGEVVSSEKGALQAYIRPHGWTEELLVGDGSVALEIGQTVYFRRSEGVQGAYASDIAVIPAVDFQVEERTLDDGSQSSQRFLLINSERVAAAYTDSSTPNVILAWPLTGGSRVQDVVDLSAETFFSSVRETVKRLEFWIDDQEHRFELEPKLKGKAVRELIRKNLEEGNGFLSVLQIYAGDIVLELLFDANTNPVRLALGFPSIALDPLVEVFSTFHKTDVIRDHPGVSFLAFSPRSQRFLGAFVE